MKQSEILKKQLQEEENDIKAFGIECKIIREVKNERFEDTWLPRLEDRITKQNIAYNADMFRYTITTNSHGIIDFYPKANKVLIRKDNKWIKPGLKWLINNMINK